MANVGLIALAALASFGAGASRGLATARTKQADEERKKREKQRKIALEGLQQSAEAGNFEAVRALSQDAVQLDIPESTVTAAMATAQAAILERNAAALRQADFFGQEAPQLEPNIPRPSPSEQVLPRPTADIPGFRPPTGPRFDPTIQRGGRVDGARVTPTPPSGQLGRAVPTGAPAVEGETAKLEAGVRRFRPFPPLLRSAVREFSVKDPDSKITFRGTRSQHIENFIATHESQGIPLHESIQHLTQRGIAVPEDIMKQAFNQYSTEFLLTEDFLRDPRAAIEQLNTRFPTEDKTAIRDFGRQVFFSAYTGAKQRLRDSGAFVTELEIARAAQVETITAVGSEFIHPDITKEIVGLAPESPQQMMSELLFIMTSEPGTDRGRLAAERYDVLLKMEIGELTAKQVAETLAEIKTRQAEEFLSATELQQLERGGQPIPFGTTPAEAARPTPVSPATVPPAAARLPTSPPPRTQPTVAIPKEEQARRTKRATALEEVRIAGEQASGFLVDIDPIATKAFTLARDSNLFGRLSAGFIPSDLKNALDNYEEKAKAFAKLIAGVTTDTERFSNEDAERILGAIPTRGDLINLFKEAPFDADKSQKILDNIQLINDTLARMTGTQHDIFPGLKQSLLIAEQESAGDALDRLLEQFNRGR